MADPICPVTPDGLHRKRPWQDTKNSRSGLACQACHRTWTWVNISPAHVHLQPTFEEAGHGG